MKKIAILQSNYIPWKGYFDLIAAVDEFIIYDDMQYTRRDWRNRNKIKTPQGTQWISIPVKVKGRFEQAIRVTELDGRQWQDSHWKSLRLNYGKAPHFSEVGNILDDLYHSDYLTITDVNSAFIHRINEYLGIDTKISYSWDYKLIAGKTERLVDLCQQAGGNEYVSGPAAKNYVDERLFSEAGIKLSWFDYQGYPKYPQLWGAFVHEVTILDLLFNCGKQSAQYMRYVNK